MTAKLAFLHDPPLARMKLEQVDGQSRTDRVYRQMRDRLMRGIFRPHQRLRIKELSQAFGTSETPVREAIFQLIRDGAVEAKTHSYFRVRRLSVAEYLELREIRLLLEPQAAAAGAGKPDGNGIRPTGASPREPDRRGKSP